MNNINQNPLPQWLNEQKPI